MKIGYDAREVFGNPAGKGQVAKKLLFALAALDTTNEYFVFVDRNDPLSLPKNFHIHHVTAPSLFWHVAVARRLVSLGIDVYLSPTSYIVPALSSVPTVPLVHDLIAFLKVTAHQEKATLVERLTLARAVKRAVRIVCASKSTESDLVRFFPAANGKTSVVYSASPVDPDDISAGLQHTERFVKLGLPESYILFVGTLEPRKNIEGILESYAKYRATTATPLPLVIVGKQGWHYKGIFETVQRLELLTNVIFAGYVANDFMPLVYKHAACFFFPSFYEGFGLIILEALMNDCPVITSKISSLPEVAGEAAYYVDPHNTDEMATALSRVLTDKTIRTTLIAAGRSQREKFSWKATAQSYLAILHDSITSKK